MLAQKIIISFIILQFILLSGCKTSDPVKSSGSMQLTSIAVGSIVLNLNSTTIATGLPTDQAILITFSNTLNIQSVPGSISLMNGSQVVAVDYSYQNNNTVVSLQPKTPLPYDIQFTIIINKGLSGKNNETFPGFNIGFKTMDPSISILSYTIAGISGTASGRLKEVPLTNLSIVVNFSVPLNTATIANSTSFVSGANNIALNYSFSDNNKTLTITSPGPLAYLSNYNLVLTSAIQGANAEPFGGLSKTFYTTATGHTSFAPLANDDALLTLVQQQTFKYFWDFGHPASGMARERNSSGNTVTTGGSGFGLMGIVAGIDRSFVTRQQGIDRINKIVTFLSAADRFHGAWAHWMDGNTGHVIPFSTNDDGGDLVETAFMMQGLLTVRQYLQAADTAGNNLINRITSLYQTVEWDWYRRGNQNVLYWHWSPDKAWIMNFPLYGYFEEQITYILAAGSPTHGIPPIVYNNGYGDGGTIKTNASYNYNGVNITLPLGSVSPLFWVQYSYQGMNPHFSDSYTNYWTQNVNATLIDYNYCIANPKGFVGYNQNCWGLTASDNPFGYDAQSPGNDNGTITPTAALSSFPYTPIESMQALKFFYYTMGDRTWGPYGFYDAFNVTEGWYANSYLAIDQGPIITMIENYRTGLLWNLFMSAPEIQTARTTLGLQ